MNSCCFCWGSDSALSTLWLFTNICNFDSDTLVWPLKAPATHVHLHKCRQASYMLSKNKWTLKKKEVFFIYMQHNFSCEYEMESKGRGRNDLSLYPIKWIGSREKGKGNRGKRKNNQKGSSVFWCPMCSIRDAWLEFFRSLSSWGKTRCWFHQKDFFPQTSSKEGHCLVLLCYIFGPSEDS